MKGVGTIGVVDGDTIERGNLHRQVLHKEALVGTSKAVSIAMFVHGLNPSVECIPYVTRFTSANALQILREEGYVRLSARETAREEDGEEVGGGVLISICRACCSG